MRSYTPAFARRLLLCDRRVSYRTINFLILVPWGGGEPFRHVTACIGFQEFSDSSSLQVVIAPPHLRETDVFQTP